MICWGYLTKRSAERRSWKWIIKKKHLQSVASQIPCSDSRKTKWISLLSFHFLSLYQQDRLSRLIASWTLLFIHNWSVLETSAINPGCSACPRHTHASSDRRYDAIYKITSLSVLSYKTWSAYANAEHVTSTKANCIWAARWHEEMKTASMCWV